MEEMVAILGQFERLAMSLAALRAVHKGNPALSACLEKAESGAIRGAELARSQIEESNGRQ